MPKYVRSVVFLEVTTEDMFVLDMATGKPFQK